MLVSFSTLNRVKCFSKRCTMYTMAKVWCCLSPPRMFCSLIHNVHMYNSNNAIRAYMSRVTILTKFFRWKKKLNGKMFNESLKECTNKQIAIDMNAVQFRVLIEVLITRGNGVTFFDSNRLIRR